MAGRVNAAYVVTEPCSSCTPVGRKQAAAPKVLDIWADLAQRTIEEANLLAAPAETGRGNTSLLALDLPHDIQRVLLPGKCPVLMV